MDTTARIVIIGAGHAGGTAAALLLLLALWPGLALSSRTPDASIFVSHLFHVIDVFLFAPPSHAAPLLLPCCNDTSHICNTNQNMMLCSTVKRGE